MSNVPRTAEAGAGSVGGIPTPAAPAHRPRRRVALPGGPHLRIVLRRLVQSVPLFFLVTASSFFLVSLSPSDPARDILGTQASPEAYEALRAQLGFDQPVYEQYWHWLTGLVSGDLGNSIFSSEPVADAVLNRLPATLSLIICALVVTLVVGVGVGVVGAVRGGVLSRLLDSAALVGFSLPSFWVGAVLIGIFSVSLGIFPATGYTPLVDSPGDWALGLVLPVAALSMQSVAVIARQTREAMLDILSTEYIRMARANGVPARSLIFRHAMKNAGIRVVTILGIQMIGLLGGTVLIESVFALPGLGSMAVEASLRKDLPVIQGIAALFTVIVIVINIVIDFAYSWLNPKVGIE